MTQKPEVFARKLFVAFICVMIGIVILTITGYTQFMFLLGLIAPYLTIEHVIKNQSKDEPYPLTWKRLPSLVFNPEGFLLKRDLACEFKKKVEMEGNAKLNPASISIVKNK